MSSGVRSRRVAGEGRAEPRHVMFVLPSDFKGESTHARVTHSSRPGACRPCHKPARLKQGHKTEAHTIPTLVNRNADGEGTAPGASAAAEGGTSGPGSLGGCEAWPEPAELGEGLGRAPGGLLPAPPASVPHPCCLHLSVHLYFPTQRTLGSLESLGFPRGPAGSASCPGVHPDREAFRPALSRDTWQVGVQTIPPCSLMGLGTPHGLTYAGGQIQALALWPLALCGDTALVRGDMRRDPDLLRPRISMTKPG